MSRQPTWGIVSTIKAPARDILNFAAWHLDLGAHRVHIYLDEDSPTARDALIAHPKCRVTLCNESYWRRRKGRPDKHQSRQTKNATHCYRRNPQVDWLAHIDVDEFLWPETPLLAQLSQLPPETFSARIRPIEALAADPDDPPPDGQIWCKGHARLQSARRSQTNEIYPTYGPHLNGGFLSHVAGKVFARTGREGIILRIHKVFERGVEDPNPARFDATKLVHLHAHDWAHWQNLYRYRLKHGSYRVGLKPASRNDLTSLTMNQLFETLESEGGEPALRAFYEEVCIATPGLRERLAGFGHLHAITLNLDEKRARYFPNAH